MSLKSLKKIEVVDRLLKGESSRTVILFDNSKELRTAADDIGDSLRTNPNFLLNRQNAFRVTNNKIIVDKAVVYLGLKQDEVQLLGHYSDGEVTYYEKG
jgi:hypothetical protein